MTSNLPARTNGQQSPAIRADRLPPQNLDAERGVLGSVLLDSSTLIEVIPELTEGCFYRDIHALIWGRIKEMFHAGKEIDSLTLADELDRHDELKTIGGDDAIAEILNSVPHAANAVYYAKIVNQKAVQRKLIEACEQTIKDAYANLLDAEELLADAEERIFQINDRHVASETATLHEVVGEVLEIVKQRSEGKLEGVPTGLPVLDRKLYGLHNSQLIILAARPSNGKSSLAQHIAHYVALIQDMPILFVSLEMGKHEYGERALLSLADVPSDTLKTGRLTAQQWKRAHEAHARIKNIHLDDAPVRTVNAIAANALRMKFRHKIKLVVIDYLQLVNTEHHKESRQEQVSQISRRLKLLAKQLDVPVLALSQMNRNIDSREDKQPRLSDLRESGSLEQDADVVMFLNRKNTDKGEPGPVELTVAKNRSGQTGQFKLWYKPAEQHWTEMVERYDEPNFGPTPDY